LFFVREQEVYLFFAFPEFTSISTPSLLLILFAQVPFLLPFFFFQEISFPIRLRRVLGAFRHIVVQRGGNRLTFAAALPLCLSLMMGIYISAPLMPFCCLSSV